MKVITGAMGLVVALTLIVAAGAFAQVTPQGDSNANNMTTNNTKGNNPTSTDPTTTPPTEDPSTSTPAPTAPATDCASEIAGMNAVLNALTPTNRTSLGNAGQLPDIPCDGYGYSADFIIVPDTSPATPAAPQSQDPTQTVTTT